MIDEKFEHWINYQKTNSKKILYYDNIDFEKIKYVGGLDISFDKKDNNRACSYLSIYDIQKNILIYEDYNICEMKIDYISGFLGFREIPEYIKLLEKIKKEEYYPELLLVDGFGILHPRKFGSASHLGYELNIPTIGIAKKLLNIDGLCKKNIDEQFKSNCVKKGDYVMLIGENQFVYGVALKSTDITTTPIYVTIGHKICLETAIKITLKLCNYKIPEPIRNSDIQSKIYL